ncbi:HesA/MoeB/ThiF family protein [Alteromonas sp. 5E99-2]|uniref:HesA/MoeB/ThiF family protein n=1 Tax=Alteromonas sp. 5E99-2 TaxID=2817683 RepID=UPI001A98A0AD|nr:HesA/MoeB/ThiF family protein [Alteromonas sp. 5E99-2]MBO1255622.1 HesA/MoeB/ThiF family protein [Alteromonas sp. 5E99-2]
MKFDLKRYDRQIALPQIDLDGQEALANSHVVIVGLGGLGCAAAQSLALMGVNNLTLIDPDTIDKSNLARQSLYTEDDIGCYKVDVAKQKLVNFNPTIEIQSFSTEFKQEYLHDVPLAKPSLVIDCTDNLNTRLFVNAACKSQLVPLITGAAIRFEGMVACISPEEDAPCYECLSKVWPDPNESCVERGIFGPVVTIIGHYQAMLAGQLIVGLKTPPPGEVQFFDGLNHTWRTMRFNQSQLCSLCTKSL